MRRARAARRATSGATIGRATWTPAGTWTTTPCDHAARDSWPSFSSAGTSPPSASSSRASASSVRMSSASVMQADAGRAGVVGERQGRDPVLVELDEPGDLARRAGRHPRWRRSSRTARPRRATRPAGPRTGVYSRLLSTASDSNSSSAASRSSRSQPGSPRSSTSASTNARSRNVTDSSVGERRAGARRACGGRRFGDLGHPSDPSISSFTSRLNSIAYSIGSSLVNTSRNPWTMRFVASFSVRPRLMR